MIRRLMIILAALALTGAVACSGGEKKGDDAPAEQPESAPMEEEEAVEEAPEEEAPADESMDEAPAEEDEGMGEEDDGEEEGEEE